VYRRWLMTWVVAFATALALVWVFLLLVDPYDSGRFSPLPQSASFDANARTADASRGRNIAFDSAIIGNSTAIALDPARLSELAGDKMRFVQLSIVKSGPREQLTVLRWFISHHTKIGAVVLVADHTWCSADESALPAPFPFWLYGSNAEYLRHLLSWHSLELSFRRIRLALGLHAPARRLDGYWDYEGENMRAFPQPPPTARDAENSAPDEVGEPVLGPQTFPYINRLTETVADLPPSSAFVLVVPPMFSSALPPPHSLAAARMAQCNAALARAATNRTGGLFLNFAADKMDRDPTNFIDAIHYRAKLARHMEKSIAAAMAEGSGGGGPQAATE
jgi:hypothetical protein